MPKWYKESGIDSDVVISSRVRLARNLEKYPFSIKLSNTQAVDLIKEINDVTESLAQNSHIRFYHCNVDSLAENDKTAMVERHVISPLLVAKTQPTGLILSEDEKISIMINEEDHLRIQSITGGRNMEEAFQSANGVDDIVDEALKIAYHEKYGYLTSCPTNAGTGLRASYMVFLPALTATGKIAKLAEELAQYQIAFRGTYGEASKSLGSLYQISNQKTLGSKERDIIDGLNRIVEQVMKQERRQREYMLINSFDEIQDQVHRAYGILRYATFLTSQDAMTLLARLKFGVDLELIKLEEDCNIHELMMEIQPGNLAYKMDKAIGSIQRDKYRASYIKKRLPNMR